MERRSFLKGVGATMALPHLDSLAFALGRERMSSPRRLAFVYVPNGIHMPDWTPRTLGAGFELPRTLVPLAPYRDQLLVFSGLTQDKARSNGDGPGDHPRAAAAYLTGAQPKKTAGRDIRVGISADQVAAKHVGHHARLRSLELGCEQGRQTGQYDSGYACVYWSTISWASERTPLMHEVDPGQVFDRLFQDGTAMNPGRAEARKSVLDLVRDDATALSPRLGIRDRRKLDEYFTAVRELERRIDHRESRRTTERTSI